MTAGSSLFGLRVKTLCSLRSEYFGEKAQKLAFLGSSNMLAHGSGAALAVKPLICEGGVSVDFAIVPILGIENQQFSFLQIEVHGM